MQPLEHNGFFITLPKPLFVVVEDVGWRQGQDGSSINEPFRSGMNREHGALDYRALLLLAKGLQMRIQLSMVLCEWDRSNLLRHVSGATWMGDKWRNPGLNLDSLDEDANFLRSNKEYLEIGLHGLGHEFWQNNRMERSEFHNTDNIMRPASIIRQHLDAFGAIMETNELGSFPNSFVPPALYHSFGNGEHSFQAILHEYGIRYVTTIFSKARQYTPPLHKKITWENDVLLVERHQAPVPWHVQAASPGLSHSGPIVCLHWKNLLHFDPLKNKEIILPWIEFLSSCSRDFNRIAARDSACCWNQFAHHCLATIKPLNEGVEIDVSQVPKLSGLSRRFFLKIKDDQNRLWRVENGKLLSCLRNGPVTQLYIEYSSQNSLLYLTPRNTRASL